MHTLVFILMVVVAALAAIAVAIAFGGPSRLLPMQSVSDPFKSVDFSDLPSLDRCMARR
jgi:non-heme chloroperoxidase